MESCKSENCHAANQVSSGYIIKETANQSVVTTLFNRIQSCEIAPSRKRLTSITSGSGTSGSKKRKLSEEGKIQGDRLDVGNEVIDDIFCQKNAPQACGPPILDNLAKVCTKFWVTDSKNDLVIKKLKSDFVVLSNCDKFYCPILNEEILKNRNIHSYYKRNDRSWFDLQNLILKLSSAVMNIANICLDADNKDRLIESKEVVVKAIDAIALLGRASKQITFKRKEWLRSALSEDYRSICNEDHSFSKFLLGDDLAENIRKAKATYLLNQLVSAKKQSSSTAYTSSTVSRNPSTLNNKASLNYQGRKKNYSNQNPQANQNNKRKFPDFRQKRN